MVHNAHPHFSHGPRSRSPTGEASASPPPAGSALVHNGIIENHDELRAELKARGYVFTSQTDTEVIAHLVDHLYDGDLLEAVQRAVPRLRGAYAIAVFCRDEPHRVVGARQGSPLVLGVGSRRRGENFLASDAMALAGVTDQIVYLEEGDVVDLQLGKHWIVARDADGPGARSSARCARCIAHTGAAELGPYRHYMQKEIFEQPKAIADTLEARARHLARAVRRRRVRVFKEIDQVLILACGTSYYSGSVAQVLARRHRQASRPRSRSRANTATATACRTRARWSSRSRRAARRPTRWRR